MLYKEDIGRLFAIMQAAYGNQWRQEADAIPVWLTKLGGFSRYDIDSAASIAIERHKKYPPSLGQFTEIVSGPRERANTYLPGPSMAQEMKWANRAMTYVLLKIGGVDSDTLKQMVSLKNALVEDFPQMDQDNFSKEVARQLTALAET